MSSNYISESISLCRNLKKAAKGDKLAAFSAVGNVVKVTEKMATLNDTLGVTARGIIDTFEKNAETSETLQVAGKFANVAKMGDEIGMVKSAVQVATSSSPIRKGIEEVLGWTTKFTAKHIMLHTVPDFVKNTKCLNNVATKVGNFAKNTKGMGQVPAIITGIGYSLATVYGPKYARKLGGWISDKIGIKPYEDEKKA